MAAGLSDVIKDLNLQELQAAAHHYAQHQEKLPILEKFEIQCGVAPREQFVEMSDPDQEKLDFLCAIYANDEEILQKLLDLRPAESILPAAIDIENIEVDDSYDEPSLEIASRSTWNEAVTMSQNLRKIIFTAIKENAEKSKIDRAKLARLLPRILTPNQSYTNDLKVLKEDYAGRIPKNISFLLDALCRQVLAIASKNETNIQDKIIQITHLYQQYEQDLKLVTQALFNQIAQDGFFENLRQIMQLSEEDKKSLTDEGITTLIVNSYMLMCFQFINTQIQTLIKRENHPHSDIVNSCIARIYQYIQSGKQGPELINNVIEQAVLELSMKKEMKHDWWQDQASAVDALRNQLKELYDFLGKNKKNRVILDVLGSLKQQEAESERYLQIVEKLEALSLLEKSPSTLTAGRLKSVFKLDSKKGSEKEAADIIKNSDPIKDRIREASVLAQKIRDLEARSPEPFIAALSTPERNLTPVIPRPPVHSAPAILGSMRLGGARSTGNVALSHPVTEPAVPAQAVSAIAITPSTGTAPASSAPVHSAPATAGSIRLGTWRYAFAAKPTPPTVSVNVAEALSATNTSSDDTVSDGSPSQKPTPRGSH